LLLDPARQTRKNINVIMKTPSRERFNEFLGTTMGQYLVQECAAVVPLAAPCFPKTCKNEESGEMEVADSTLSFAYTEECWREVKMMPATVGATISQRNAAHQALLMGRYKAAVIIEEDMGWTADAPLKFKLITDLMAGHWHEHMGVSLTHGDSASHTTLVATTAWLYRDVKHGLHIKDIPMRSWSPRRPQIKWAGIGTRAILYTPMGLRAIMNHTFSLRASDVDLVQGLIQQGSHCPSP
jgi:hypothetical protein